MKKPQPLLRDKQMKLSSADAKGAIEWRPEPMTLEAYFEACHTLTGAELAAVESYLAKHPHIAMHRADAADEQSRRNEKFRSFIESMPSR